MAQFVEVKSANVSGIFQIVSNRGVCWQVRGEEGDTFLVQKKQVVRGPWEETEEEPTPTPNPTSTSSVAAQLVAATTAKPSRAAAATKERDPNLVTLKQLCFDLDLEPRIARRRLRGSVGQVGTGSRWEWEAGSEELDKVRALLAKAPAPAPAPAAE